jgi:hypothetical protein
MLQYHAVRVTADAISEMRDEQRALTAIPRDDIVSIELVRASESAHPIMQAIFGLALIIVGLLPIIAWFQNGGIFVGEMILLTTAAVFGALCFYDALHRVPVLRVKTIRGASRLAFRGPATQAELREFVNQMQDQFGYSVTAR